MIYRNLVCIFLAVLFVFPLSALAEGSCINKPVTTAEGYTITPKSIRISDGTVNHNEPEAGKAYFIVCFELTNNSDSEYSFRFGSNLVATQGGVDLGLPDAYQVQVEITASQMNEGGYGNLSVNSLPAGETTIGETGWIIDENWEEIVITFFPEPFGDAAAEFTFHPEDLYQ